jgi:hypothetical protein
MPGVALEVLRELTEKDLEVRSEAKPPGTINTILGFHHAQARLLAQGLTPTAVAAALGTSPRRLGVLREDPAFQELVSYYQEQENVIYLENREKAALLGRLAMDLLQERLETNGKSVPTRELKEIAMEMGDRSDFPRVQSTGGQAPTTITFNFGTPLRPGQTIDGALVVEKDQELLPESQP